MTTKTVLITGASRGLGLALARALAEDGWQLILDARGADALQTAAAELAKITQVTAVPGDVADPNHRQALAEAANAWGGLDAIINNASILGLSPQPALLDYPLEALADVYRINVLAPLALLQAVRPYLKSQARIINVTSDAAVNAYEGWGGYGSSKAAFEQMTAVLAAENPEYRFYWVDPGDIRTQMHQEAFPDEDISDRPLPEVSIPGFLALINGNWPNGRYQAQSMLAEKRPTGGVRELRLSITADDFTQTVAFYKDGLSMPTVEEWSDPVNGQGLILAAGQATLEILDKTHADYVNQIETGSRAAGPLRLALQVPDLQQSAAQLREAGPQTLNGPVQTPWGDFNWRLQGPDGLQITLFQSSAEPELSKVEPTT
jgi:NAD(P)-dependent dehydrogenase (short-subunit alcohol dehydrogenase family)